MDALRVREWEGDSDPRAKSIRAFALMIDNLWYKPLSKLGCLSRVERKCIRNVIRDYMRSVEPLPPEKNPSGMPVQWLLEEFRNRNPYFQQLIEYNKGVLKVLLGDVRAYYNVDTVGKYVLFMVFSILRVEFLNGSEFVGLGVHSSRAALRARLTHAFVSLLTYGTYINHYEHSEYMFVGAPMYWAQYVDYHLAYQSLYENAFLEVLPYAKMYRAYFEYVRMTVRHTGSEVRSLMLQFCGETWALSVSAPEFILEALCYTVADRLTKTDRSRVLLYLEELDKDKDERRYLCHELDSDFREVVNSGMAGTPHVQLSTHNDISAIYIEHADGSPDERDWYYPTYKLITPSQCGEQLVLQQYLRVEPPHRDVRIDLHVTARPEEEEEEGEKEEEGEEEEEGEAKFPEDEPPQKETPGVPDDEPPSGRGQDNAAIPGGAEDRVQLLRRQILWLERHLQDASSCCNANKLLEARLSHHLETMRQYSVLLSRKTDVQSGFEAEVWPSPHALDGSRPRGLELPKALWAPDMVLAQ